jgi:hypothetical protein
MGSDPSCAHAASHSPGSGSLYVAGYTLGTLPGQTSAGGEDAFARKYDSAGSEQWTRQFGTSSYDCAQSVTGSAHMAGLTGGTFAGQTSAGGMDAFVARLNP